MIKSNCTSANQSMILTINNNTSVLIVFGIYDSLTLHQNEAVDGEISHYDKFLWLVKFNWWTSQKAYYRHNRTVPVMGSTELFLVDQLLSGTFF